MNEPRRHHYLPVAYLSAFESAADGTLTLVSVDGHRWNAPPRAVAFERDLYRVEGVSGIDPNDFEKDFSNLEGAYAAVLRDIEGDRHLPDRSSWQFQTILDFLGLLLVRSPIHRDSV